MKIELFGPSFRDPGFEQANPSRLTNVYRVPSESGPIIRICPGVEKLPYDNTIPPTTRPNPAASTEIDGDVWTVADGFLVRLREVVPGEYYWSSYGATPGVTPSICGNNGNICVANGGVYYVWDGTALTTPTGGRFSVVTSVETLAQRTIMAQANGREFQWTAVAQPKVLNGTFYATAESTDDKIVRLAAVNGNLWLLKEKSTEIWFPTATGFSRVAGGVIERGLSAPRRATKFPGGIFFIGDDNVVYASDGGALRRVSTTEIEAMLSSANPTHCFYYETMGSKFCVISFAARRAMIWDVSTNEWHYRGSNFPFEPWEVVDSAKAFGKSIALLSGGKYGFFSNVDTEIRNSKSTLEDVTREIISRTVRTGTPFRVARLEIEANVGFAYSSSTSMSLQTSNDGGKTWGSVMTRSLGDGTQSARKVVWRALGQFDSFTFKVSGAKMNEIGMKAHVYLETA